MEKIGDVPSVERKVLDDVIDVLQKTKSIVNTIPVSAAEGVELLAQLRTAIYEDLNQIQHEFLVLLAVRWAQTHGYAPIGVQWFWNPRQGGGSAEPDLLGEKDGEHLISGEVTSSDRPKGVISTRMKATLEKLSRCKGRRFYFVRTENMRRKAEMLVRKDTLPIEIVRLQHDV